MSSAFGPKWGHRIGYLIAQLADHYGDSPGSWPHAAIVQLSHDTMPRLAETPVSSVEPNDELAVAA
jgi:hypothetical protein